MTFMRNKTTSMHRGGDGSPRREKKDTGVHQPYEMSHTYDLWNPERGASQRVIVIIDKEGIIRYRRIS